MDVFKPFLQRLLQPVIFSFCVAWIFWNWEITVGFLWYNSETLPRYSYSNYRDLIVSNSNAWKNYVLPLLSAMFYLPIRYCLNWFSTFIRTKERDLLLRVSGTGKVSTLKYLTLRKSYEDRISELSKYLEEQTDIQNQINNFATEQIKYQEISQKQKNEIIRLNTELTTETHRANLSFDEISHYKVVSNSEYLLGNYDLEIRQDLFGEKVPVLLFREEISISKVNDVLVINTVDTKKLASIEDYFVNVFSKEMMFYIKTDARQSFNIESLFGGKYFKGIYNENTKTISGKTIHEGGAIHKVLFTKLHEFNSNKQVTKGAD